TVSSTSAMTETMTYTAATGGVASGGVITMSVPASWSTPQTTSNSTAGYTRVSIAGGSYTTTGIGISGSGPWTITVTLSAALNAGQTVVLAYGDATGDPAGAAIGGSTGSASCQVRETSTAGGTLTGPSGLSSSQTVLIVYGDASGNAGGAAVAPSTANAGDYTFQVQEKSTSGGTLTNVAGTQTVTVNVSADGAGTANVSPTTVS